MMYMDCGSAYAGADKAAASYLGFKLTSQQSYRSIIDYLGIIFIKLQCFEGNARVEVEWLVAETDLWLAGEACGSRA